MSKSYEVDYAFGQMGSAITDGANPIFPPKGMVRVAIQALEDTTLHATGGLVSEVQVRAPADDAYRFINTEDDSHADGDFGVGSCHNGNSSTTTTITLGAAATEIKPGQIIESAVMFPRSAASLKNPFRVASYTAGASTLTVNRPGAALASGSAENLFFFFEDSQGFGGLEMDASDKLPKGITIYGRWTAVKLSGAGAGRIITYFGK